jgi:hypothetical protein
MIKMHKKIKLFYTGRQSPNIRMLYDRAHEQRDISTHSV